MSYLASYLSSLATLNFSYPYEFCTYSLAINSIASVIVVNCFNSTFANVYIIIILSVVIIAVLVINYNNIIFYVKCQSAGYL